MGRIIDRRIIVTVLCGVWEVVIILVISTFVSSTNFENIIDSEDIHYSLQRDCQWLIKGNDALANFGGMLYTQFTI